MNETVTPTLLPVRKFTTSGIMVTILVSLIPALGLQLWLAGAPWALTLLCSCTMALLLEAVALRLRGRQVGFHLLDGNMLVTAALLLLMLPGTAPWWLPIAGISIAVAGKHIYGGLGQCVFNPVALAYLGLMTLFPDTMASHGPGLQPDVGMTLALLAGAMYLLLQRIISWHIPMTVILTAGLCFYVVDMTLPGSLTVFVAFFLATDPGTSPGTRRGKLVYALLIALLFTMMTNWLTYAAAAAAALLIMNAAAPMLDQLIRHDGKRRSNPEQTE